MNHIKHMRVELKPDMVVGVETPVLRVKVWIDGLEYNSDVVLHNPEVTESELDFYFRKAHLYLVDGINREKAAND